MSRFTAVVVEDEPRAREWLAHSLAAVPWLSVAATAADAIAGRAAIERCRPDVVLVDISLPGASGLEMLAGLPDPPLIVFTTAHPEHAVDAFTLGAVDYLMKPFGGRRLALMLDRLRERLGSRRPSADPPLDQVPIRTGPTVLTVPLADVVRFEGSGDYVRVHTARRTHLANLRLDELETRLPGNEFLRIHRSHIIRRRALRELRADGTGRYLAVLEDGTELRSSRRRSAALRALLGRR
ncbi:MAG: LytTR family DNA-binding domain-containing protein [Gemmatimonadales bacterium]